MRGRDDRMPTKQLRGSFLLIPFVLLGCLVIFTPACLHEMNVPLLEGDSTSTLQETLMLDKGYWEGEYIDIEGHHARLLFEITQNTPRVVGTFQLILPTEDQAERIEGMVTGYAEDQGINLDWNAEAGVTLSSNLMLTRPLAHAQQALYGVATPVPQLRLGGGVLIAWKFNSRYGSALGNFLDNATSFDVLQALKIRR